MADDTAIVSRGRALPAKQEADYMSGLHAQAASFIDAGVPENTRRAYRSQWKSFVTWCLAHDQPYLPTTSEALILYMTARSGEVKVSSLTVALAAITAAHREHGHTDWAAADMPHFRMFMRGLRRAKQTPTVKKKAITLEDLLRGLPKGDATQAVRDRAILLVGFFSAMRRSELAQLDVADLLPDVDGVKLFIRASKTDQDAKGQYTGIPKLDDPCCPVQALNAWLDVRGREPGPLFGINAKRVAQIVKAAAERAGLDPDIYSGHSLRSGIVTEGSRLGVDNATLMRLTRHKSERMVDEYIQTDRVIHDHVGRKVAAELKR